LQAPGFAGDENQKNRRRLLPIIGEVGRKEQESSKESSEKRVGGGKKKGEVERERSQSCSR